MESKPSRGGEAAAAFKAAIRAVERARKRAAEAAATAARLEAAAADAAITLAILNGGRANVPVPGGEYSLAGRNPSEVIHYRITDVAEYQRWVDGCAAAVDPSEENDEIG